MRTRKQLCEICGIETDHQIEADDDDCELALCLRCGRLTSARTESEGPCDQCAPSGPPQRP